jgi:hypothetical protein
MAYAEVSYRIRLVLRCVLKVTVGIREALSPNIPKAFTYNIKLYRKFHEPSPGATILYRYLPHYTYLLRGLSPQANYTDRATDARRRS